MHRPPTTYTVEDQLRMSRARNYFAWQNRLVSGELGPRVLEIGCGVGNFTGTLLNRELVIAADAESQCIDELRARYPHAANLRPVVCALEDPEFLQFRRDRIDSCLCLNVLEHIEDDRRAMESMRAVLVDGGVAVMMVPAFPSLYGPIDHNLGHYRRYSRESLTRLAAAAGMRLRKLHYMNAFGFFGWWVNARVWPRQAQSEAQISFFDRWIVPVLSRAETAVKPPFGQSLFAVLEKH